MAHRNLIVAIHGILTRTTDPSWPDRLRAFAFRDGYDADVIASQYFALGIPVVEVGGLNWFRARQLLGDIEPYLQCSKLPKICIVAHSNGCDIALRVANDLWSRGHNVETLMLSCGAAESDVRQNGVYAAVMGDRLGRAIAWCGRQDTLIASPWIWPYGHLGAEGWRCDGTPFVLPEEDGNGSVETWWYDGGHCHLFAPERREETFNVIMVTCGAEADARRVVA